MPAHLSEFVQYVNGGDVESEASAENEENEENVDNEENDDNKNEPPPSLLLPDTLSLTSIPPSLIVGPSQQKETLTTLTQLEALCEEIGVHSQRLSDAHGQLGLLLEDLAKSSPSPHPIPSASYQQLVAVQQRYIGDKTRHDVQTRLSTLKSAYATDYHNLKTTFDKEYKSAVSALKESEVINTQLRRGRVRNLVQYRESLDSVSAMVAEIDAICSNHYVHCAERLQGLVDDVGKVFNSLMDDQVQMHKRLSDRDYKV